MTRRLEIALDGDRLARLEVEASVRGLTLEDLVRRALAEVDPPVPTTDELRRRGRAALARGEG